MLISFNYASGFAASEIWVNPKHVASIRLTSRGNMLLLELVMSSGREIVVCDNDRSGLKRIRDCLENSHG